MSVSSIGAGPPLRQLAPANSSEASEAPGVNDHDADDVGGSEPVTSARPAPGNGTGTVLDKIA